MEGLKERIQKFKDGVEEVRISQEANKKQKEKLEKSLENFLLEIVEAEKDIAKHDEALDILRVVSDQSVRDSYRFITDAINKALARMFTQERRIKLNEFKLGIHPQLEIELYVENGKKRSLKSNSGHGIAQIISLLTLLSIIVITKARRLVILDEAMSGLSGSNRQIISDIMWNFTQIGFQFIINEHGFIPKGAEVYYLKNVNGVSNVKAVFTEQHGVYLSVLGDTDDGTDGEYEKMVERNKDAEMYLNYGVEDYEIKEGNVEI